MLYTGEPNGLWCECGLAGAKPVLGLGEVEEEGLQMC